MVFFFFSHVTSSRHDSHKPRTQFAHKRTVRLIVDKDVEDIDALRLAQSLRECSREIKGVVLLFRRPRNLPRRALILRTFTCRNCLAFSDNETFGFRRGRIPERGSAHLLTTHGELKSQNARHLFFTEEPRALITPRTVSTPQNACSYIGGRLQVTCHRCHSTEHGTNWVTPRTVQTTWNSRKT